MPKRPERTVALYDEEQVEAYEAAREQLAADGVDVEDHSEGDVLAAISRRYTATRAEDTREDTREKQPVDGSYMEALELFGPVVGMVASGLLVVFLVAWYLL